MIVAIEPEEFAPREANIPARAKIEVTDIRKEAELERTTIGGISMGRILLEPPEAELIREIVEAKTDILLASWPESQTPPTILCGIRVFEIETPATVVYWDINTNVELVLRADGEDRTVSGAATERTWVWPTQTIIERVTNEALKQLAGELQIALEELLRLPSE